MPSLTDADVHTYRCRARERLEYACGVPESTAVEEGHPRYREVTADLDPGSRGVHPDPFSSCAVLAMWLYVTLGVRLSWIDHPLAARGWRGDGAIVSRLVTHGLPYSRDTRYDCGDVLVIADRWPSGADSHVVCVVTEPEPGLLCTAEYGQPGGALRERIVMADRLCTHRADGRLVVGRTIRTVLPLARVLASAYTQGLLA